MEEVVEDLLRPSQHDKASAANCSTTHQDHTSDPSSPSHHAPPTSGSHPASPSGTHGGCEPDQAVLQYGRSAPEGSLLMRSALHSLVFGNARAVAWLWQRWVEWLCSFDVSTEQHPVCVSAACMSLI